MLRILKYKGYFLAAQFFIFRLPYLHFSVDIPDTAASPVSPHPHVTIGEDFNLREYLRLILRVIVNHLFCSRIIAKQGIRESTYPDKSVLVLNHIAYPAVGQQRWSRQLGMYHHKLFPVISVQPVDSSHPHKSAAVLHHTPDGILRQTVTIGYRTDIQYIKSKCFATKQ